MKRIELFGITSLDAVEGTSDWYFAMDHLSGDLYEAEELYLDRHPIDRNRLLFVHYPDGAVFEPEKSLPGRYFGLPLFEAGRFFYPCADFPSGKLLVREFLPEAGTSRTVGEIPRAGVEDYYNIRLFGSPLMLTRQGMKGTFEILWPEAKAFSTGVNESFLFREGDRYFFSAWFEDPDYREEVLVRSAEGKLLERMPGDIRIMPGGEKWHIL